MSREILEAMTALAREKGIAPDKLQHALEDAMLSAYKKQAGAAKYAKVELDPDTGDYRVIELILDDRLEAHLIVETIDENTYLDEETGEFVEPEDVEIDADKFEEYADQIQERDVTPDDFGRIAAQTAKQVILQRVREAERDMMFEEYRDRVGELVTGIVQQKDARYTLIQLRERVEALLPKSEQVDGERYEHNQRVKAVIKEVSASTKGPSWRMREQTSFLRSPSSASIAANSLQPSFITSSTNASRVPEVGGGPRTSIFSAGSDGSTSFQVWYGLSTSLPPTGTCLASAVQICFSLSV